MNIDKEEVETIKSSEENTLETIEIFPKLVKKETKLNMDLLSNKH